MRPFKQATGKIESALRVGLLASGLTFGIVANTANAITFANDPNLGAVSPGTYLDGTVRLIPQLGGACSGALLSTVSVPSVQGSDAAPLLKLHSIPGSPE